MNNRYSNDPQLERLVNAIAQRVGPQRFSVWFDGSTRLVLRQDALEIMVPDDFHSEWIGRNYMGVIQEAAQEVLGTTVQIRFNVTPQLLEGKEVRRRHLEEEAAAAAPPKQSAAVKAPLSVPAKAAYVPPARVSVVVPVPRLDLDTFVVGRANQTAYNAVTHVAQFPGVNYNPLFVYSACGLGKTHLLQGLIGAFQGHHPTKRVLYMAGEAFTNEFLFALKHQKLEMFRRKVRDLDLLVIDDVQFLDGKRTTQEEFEQTLNAILANGRQVVFASECHPQTLEGFGEGLIARFMSGSVVRIDPPNKEMRVKILKRICRRMELSISDEVIDWIAERVTQNVRELEGAITRLAAHVKLHSFVPDLNLIPSVLSDLEHKHSALLKPDGIIAAVCECFGVEKTDLLNGRRHHNICLARSVAMHMVRERAGVRMSYPEIGAIFGRRNHSTVISACRRMTAALARNDRVTWQSTTGECSEELRELIQQLEERGRALG